MVFQAGSSAFQVTKILLVEDDEELSSSLDDYLSGEGYTVDVVNDGGEALERVTHFHYDVMVLDLNLPTLDGLDVCSKYRQSGGVLPIIMLTGRRELKDKEVGLISGADDYLTKPFHARELSARIRALLRRPRQYVPDVLTAGDLSLDPTTRRVIRGSEEITLAPQQFALLEFFMKHPGQVFSADALLERVWSTESETSADAVRVHITHLRNKIDVDGQPSHIKTTHRVGYSFETPVRKSKD